MTLTWTSGYNIDEAVPLVEWGVVGENKVKSPAGTLTFDRSSMCGNISFTTLIISSTVISLFVMFLHVLNLKHNT